MPDYRRTREEETQLYPQLVQFPSDPYISPNSLGGPGMGGAGNEGGMGLAPQAALGGVDERLASIQQLGDQRRGLEDQLASMQGQPSTRLMTTGEMWQGLKDIGSSGLDLLGRGARAILPTQEGWNEGAMRLQNANAIVNGGTPLWMMQQQHQTQMGQHQELMALKRQQLSQQLQAHNEAKRQHDMQLFEKAMSSPKAHLIMKTLAADPNFSMAPQAGQISRVFKESDYAKLKTRLQYLPPEIQQDFLSGNLDDDSAAEWAKEMEAAAKADAEFRVKDTILTQAKNTPPDKRSPRQQQLMEEHEAELEMAKLKPRKAQAEITEKETQADMQTSHARLYDWQREHGGVGDKGLGHDREAFTQQLFGPGKLYKDLTQKQMEKVNTAVATHQGTVQFNRSYGSQQAQLQVPDKPAPAEREKAAEDMSVLGLIDDMDSKYSPDYVGPLRGRAGSVMETFGGITEDEANFRAQVATLRNGVIKAITGAQMSEPEAKRIMDQIPDPLNPPEVFEARLKATRQNMKRLAQKRRDVLKGSGIETSGLPQLPQGKKKSKFQEDSDKQIQSVLDEVLGK